MHNEVGPTTSRVDCTVSNLTELGSKEAEMRIFLAGELHFSLSLGH